MRRLRFLRLLLLVGVAVVAATPMLASPSIQQGDSIDYGDFVRDRVSNDRGDEWTFLGDEGDEVWIEMASDDIDTYLELLGPDGDLLTENDDSFGTDSLIENYVLPETGRYTIVARSFSGETGAYTLSLELTDTGVEIGTGGGRIGYGELVTGRVTTDAGDEWAFSGDEGDEIRIAMTSSAMDTYLELYGPDGDYLTDNDDDGASTNSLIEGYVLADSGTFTIMARGYGGETGQYNLSLDQTDSGVEITSGGRIGYGETVRGRVFTDLGDEWTFTAQAGDVVTISMQSDSLDTYLELLDADGFLVTENDDSVDGTDSLIENYWLADGGTYTIVASGYGGGTGPYRLTLEQMNQGGELGLGTDNSLLLGLGVAVGVLCLGLAAAGGLVGIVLLVRRSQGSE